MQARRRSFAGSGGVGEGCVMKRCLVWSVKVTEIILADDD